jgi:glycosyltransferase involved in cell wall biosynthesis
MWQRVILFFARHLYRHADLVVTVAGALNNDVAELLRVPSGKIMTIYNGVFKPEIHTLAAADSPHPWLDNTDIPVFLAVGRLSREKGMDTLIEAFRRVRAKRRCRLIVYGEGEERPALESQVSETGCAEDIAFPGFIANPFAAMARAAVFVLPSRSEGLPGALIQAMACGSSVVATDTFGGAAEVLENGKWGLLVKPEDPESMSNAMSCCLDSPISADVRLRASHFSESGATERYIEALRLTCIGRPQRVEQR